MKPLQRILVLQTAFIGDVILTLPLVQVLKEFFPGAEVDVVAVPRAAEVCHNHPAINAIIEYEKRGKDAGWSGFWRLVRTIKQRNYQLAVIPHRSLRSALLGLFSGAPLRIGFARGAGSILMTKRVHYEDSLHEVERNLSLLQAIGITHPGKVLPRVYPIQSDATAVDSVMAEIPGDRRNNLVAMAPGTIWNTKRWLKERFAELAGTFANEGFAVVLVGGKEDDVLCAEIKELAKTDFVYSTAGKLSILESAELLRRCRITISNDSAPLHLSVAVGTPVVAIFGATVPAFGFAPYGPRDRVVETRGLPCRPCSIHGGAECPIKTFECMVQISSDRVHARVMDVLQESGKSGVR